MTPLAYTGFLHAHIPLTAAMQLQVVSLAPGQLVLRAPLAPNRNHHGTAFGGSLASLGLVAGWGLVDRGLAEAGLSAQLVVQHSEAEFIAPARGELQVTAQVEDADWRTFVEDLQRQGRARVTVSSRIDSEGRTVQQTRARYAARRSPG
jgi:thioesterase domain-containing protein